MARHHAFGKRSENALATVDGRLDRLCREVLRAVPFDLTITCGRRSKEDQEKAVQEGRSKVHWPHGKHNVSQPSDLARAVDIHPYPIDWNDLPRYIFMHGAFAACADKAGIRIRHGIDWDGDGVLLKDQSLDDYPHVELLDE